MKIMVFDTETTGLPKSRKSLLENTEEWPFIVQLSWLTYDTETSTICSISDNIIRLPDGFVMSDECIAIHGISNEMSRIKGINRYAALIKFMDEFEKVDLVIAHNMDFDKNGLLVELIREKNERNNSVDNYYIESRIIMLLRSTKLGCTMQDGMNFCNIIATYKNSPKKYVKFPTLGELHNRCFGFVPKKLHNSLNDSVVCLRCFYQLRFNKDIVLENEQLREMIELLKP